MGAVLCAVVGHRWHVDETSTDSEAVLRCERCHRRELAPGGTPFNARLDAQTRANRALR
jgi:hypothetical protein